MYGERGRDSRGGGSQDIVPLGIVE